MRLWLLPLVAACPDCPAHVQLLQRSLTLRKASVSNVSSLSFLERCSGWDCLKEYVSTDDGAFRWHVTTRVIAGDGWKGSVLEMTSQRWLPNLVTPDTWNHTLVVITPSNVTQDDYALLYIALGFYGSVQVPSAFVSRLDEDVKAAADMASAAGTRAAVLFNVPSEYLTLKSPMPSTQPLVEDGLLSASWAGFKDLHGALAPSLLELPMTKATVKAMDVLGHFLKMQSFVLMGTSKRGNLCWNTASVDNRVKGIVSIARPLNVRAVLRRTQKELGGFPVAAKLYVEKGLLGNYLDSATGQSFLNITDAYHYLPRVANIAKLVINAGNDDFFIPDNTKDWWEAVPGPKWMTTIPNSKHIVGGAQDYQSVLGVSAMDDDGPELILDLPEDEKEKDDLLSVRISRWIDGQLCSGRVADVCVGELSRERLYLVEYLDSDVEHLTEEEIREGLMLWATGEVEPFVDDGMEDEETIGYLSENEKEVRELAPIVSAFLRADLRLPTVTCKIEEDGAIAVAPGSVRPEEVRLWQADSCDSHRMDFRFVNAEAKVCENQGAEWRSTLLSAAGPWHVRPNVTKGRWTAFFLSFQWPGGATVSTEVSVVPTKLPFDCDAAHSCEGIV